MQRVLGYKDSLPECLPNFITGEILFAYKIVFANKFGMLYVFEIGCTSVHLLASEGRVRLVEC